MFYLALFLAALPSLVLIAGLMTVPRPAMSSALASRLVSGSVAVAAILSLVIAKTTMMPRGLSVLVGIGAGAAAAVAAEILFVKDALHISVSDPAYQDVLRFLRERTEAQEEARAGSLRDDTSMDLDLDPFDE